MNWKRGVVVWHIKAVLNDVVTWTRAKGFQSIRHGWRFSIIMNARRIYRLCGILILFHHLPSSAPVLENQQMGSRDPERKWMEMSSWVFVRQPQDTDTSRMMRSVVRSDGEVLATPLCTLVSAYKDKVKYDQQVKCGDSLLPFDARWICSFAAPGIFPWILTPWIHCIAQR